jgi:hypothetical protein
MKEFEGKNEDGISYHYFKCEKCGEEVLDMKQLHDMSQKYRQMKKFHTKISRWGLSLGFRIPKELVKRYNLKDKKEVAIIPEENGIRIIPI